MAETKQLGRRGAMAALLRNPGLLFDPFTTAFRSEVLGSHNIPTPVDALKWAAYYESNPASTFSSGIKIRGGGTVLGTFGGLISIPMVGLKGALQIAATGAAADLLGEGCSSPTDIPKPTGPEPTPTQIEVAVTQASAVDTAVPTARPAELLQPTEDHLPSTIPGLALGQLEVLNPQTGTVEITTVGTVEGYLSGINTLYDPKEPAVTKAFGIDQSFLKKYFAVDPTDENTKYARNGSKGGPEVILDRGVWKEVESGKVFIPFNPASEGYPVIDVNDKIQQVIEDPNTGKVTPIGPARELFQNPQDIAKSTSFNGDISQVASVEIGKGGVLTFVSQVPKLVNLQLDKTVQIVNEVPFIGEPEDLSLNPVTETTAAAFSKTLLGAGFNIAAEDIKKNLTVMRIEGLDPTDLTKQKKKNYDIATFTIEDEKVGGDYPLMIKNESGEWEKATMGKIFSLAGYNCGTNLNTPRLANPPYTIHDQLAANDLVAQNYNSALLEGLAWVNTEYEPGKISVNPHARPAVDLARKLKMKIIEGDDLIYGRQAQKWTYLREPFEYKGELIDIKRLKATDSEKAKRILTELMEAHITNLVKEYRGRVNQWSVVNEIGVNQGEDIFMDIIGPEYIEKAFTAARKADPDAILMLNDDKSDTMTGSKYERIREIVDTLSNIVVEGRPLIDAIGLQMHVDASNPPTKEDLVAGFNSWRIPVIISSHDINMKGFGGSNEDKVKRQAEIGTIVLQAAVESGVVTDFNFWDGVQGKFSWLEDPNKQGNSNADPTPFDDDGNQRLWAVALQKELIDNLQR